MAKKWRNGGGGGNNNGVMAASANEASSASSKAEESCENPAEMPAKAGGINGVAWRRGISQ
jgi:hypothetical protein